MKFQGPPHPQQQSGLFTKLPPELRSQVWKYVLSSGHDSNVLVRRRYKQDRYEWLRPDRRPGGHSILSLLAVCRATHDEAAGIFYYDHSLRIHHLDLKAFIKSTSLPRRASVRRLTIDAFAWEDITAACRLLRHLPHITDVSFTLGDDYHEERREREWPMLKRCGLQTIASASIGLKFRRGPGPYDYRPQREEGIQRMFGEAVKAAQTRKARKKGGEAAEKAEELT